MITIDATALSLELFTLVAEAGGFAQTGLTATVQTFDPPPGAYRFRTGTFPAFRFAVTDAGTIAFDPGLAFLAGAGTNVLTVRGFALRIDATALTFNGFILSEPGRQSAKTMTSTATVLTVTLIPGPHLFIAGREPDFQFTVTDGGTIELDPALAFLAGAGTDLLTVRGFDLRIDASALSTLSFPGFVLSDASGQSAKTVSSATATVTLIPGPYRIIKLTTPNFQFTLMGAGTVAFDPELSTFLAGAGTNLLTVRGFALQIDATALSFDQFTLLEEEGGFGLTMSARTVQTVTLIPGPYRLGIREPVIHFTLTNAGTVAFAPGLTTFLAGAGTNLLTVRGFALQIDATALTLDQFTLIEARTQEGKTFSDTTVQVQTLRLIPGSYLFGTRTTDVPFALTDAGTVAFDPGLTFLAGAGTGLLTVRGFALQIDATEVSLATFTIAEAGSGLSKTLPSAGVQPVDLIPGSYRLGAHATTDFVITSSGVFDYVPADALFFRGRGSRALRVLETAMPLEEVISTDRVGQITGSTNDGWPDLVDAMGWPLLTDTLAWGAQGADLGANTDYPDEQNGRLYIFFGDTTTNQGPNDPPINSDMVAWTDARAVLRHGGHLPIGLSFVLPFSPTAIAGQEEWSFCGKCHGLFFKTAARNICPADGTPHVEGSSDDSAPRPFVIPFEPTTVDGQHGWGFCAKCSGMFWNGDARFKGICPAGGSHDAAGFVFVPPFQADGGQPDWRFCRNCGGLHWTGAPKKGVCAGASGGGFHLNAVIDPDKKFFDKFSFTPFSQNNPFTRTDDRFNYTASFETPNGAFSWDGRVYVFAGITDEGRSGVFRPEQPVLGQYLLSKDNPATPGPYQIDFLFSPKTGPCVRRETVAGGSFLARSSHRLVGNFVPDRNAPADPQRRESGYRSCRKCQSLFWDGDPAFKGVCRDASGSPGHEADPSNMRVYSFAHGVPEDAQNRAGWTRCKNCLMLFAKAPPVNGICPVGNAEHVADERSHDLLVPRASIQENGKNQANWRFCGKCKGLFWQGDGFATGICPKDRIGHQPIGHNFVLSHDAGEDATKQTNWRFCAKCAGLFFDGSLDKGMCPNDSAGHAAAGFIFSLEHDFDESAPGHHFDETLDRQPEWRFCRKCSVLFFNGSAAPSVCPRDGGNHELAGLNFALRHNPGEDADGSWKVCTQCHGMAWVDREGAIPWVASFVVDNARHAILPQNTGKGLVMIGYGFKAFRLAWMPLQEQVRPEFPAIRYFHRRKKAWSEHVDNDEGWELFSHPTGEYTHVSAAWLKEPEQWIVVYGTADLTGPERAKNPAVARFSKDLVNWSDPVVLFDPFREQAYGAYMHMPGKDLINPKVPPAEPPGPDNPGWAYGVFLLNRFTTWDASNRKLGLYYLLSFGSPYQVHVMHSVIRLP